MMYSIQITHQAKKDIEKLTPKLKLKLKEILINLIALDPYSGKKLIGDLFGSYSFRLNIKDRLVYSIDEKAKIVYIERAKTHYGE
ncbi:MAG: type II toxin-antitoxin system RelE/ParE family toxin [Candidatus Omnitrophica bacterium]|nr:type II toxin-antitoxin system RelE/ParE family toxin [Candidatus Omnitrophota bacterium]